MPGRAADCTSDHCHAEVGGNAAHIIRHLPDQSGSVIMHSTRDSKNITNIADTALFDTVSCRVLQFSHKCILIFTIFVEGQLHLNYGTPLNQIEWSLVTQSSWYYTTPPIGSHTV